MDRVVRCLDRVGPVRKPSVAERSIHLLPRQRMVDTSAKAVNTVSNSVRSYGSKFATHPAFSRFVFTVASGKRVVVGPAWEVDGSVSKCASDGTERGGVDVPVPGMGP